ncbi:MAG TPA: carbohydrate ABC transporter permease [Tepidisphaeraceae bacterium]|nr:carbohydrate ABC transporter permease [Tepidisphaeraceae bacterium]
MNAPRLNLTTRIVTHAILIALTIVVLFPIIWIIFASLKKQEDLFDSILMPRGGLSSLTLDNFRTLLTARPFFGWMLNSVFIASTQTILTVLLGTLGGFALAKYRFTCKPLIMGVMFATMLLPGQVLLPSSYELMRALGWIDSFFGIIVPGAVSVFGMFLFMQSIKNVPDELLDAARIDGASEFYIWWEIVMPTIRPMVGAYTLMSFLGAWNSFLWPQIVLQDERKYTLPIGLANMLGTSEYLTNYGVLMAGTLLAVLPVVALFFLLQREFISGLTSGALKG